MKDAVGNDTKLPPNSIRSRHVEGKGQSYGAPKGTCWYCATFSDGEGYFASPWPCDAIREADRADKAEAALAEVQDTAIAELQRLHTLKDKAEAALAEKQTELFRMSDVLTATQEQCERHQQDARARADKAEAALAECRAERDAAIVEGANIGALMAAEANARADKAEAALVGKYGFEAAGMVLAAQEERDAARAALAAHKDATE